MTTTTRICARNGQKCGQCEYFDREFGDCLSRHSDRFQTTAEREACPAFYPDTSARDKETAC